jgi:hypothetical protein
MILSLGNCNRGTIYCTNNLLIRSYVQYNVRNSANGLLSLLCCRGGSSGPIQLAFCVSKYIKTARDIYIHCVSSARKHRICQYIRNITPKRTRWSRGCVLAFSTQVRGFKPGRSRWIFQGEKFLSTTSFGGEVKPSVPCRRFSACKISLK